MEVLITMGKQGNDTMQITITVSRQLMKKVDESAKALYLSRSAYITAALAQKLQSEEILRALPDFTDTVKRALRQDALSKKLDFNMPDTDMPYMDATREGAEKLDFIQGMEKDNDKAK